MNTLALILVLSSALLHTFWNFSTKRSVNKHVFIVLALGFASILLIPVGVILLLTHPVSMLGWCFVVITTGLHAAYFRFISISYSKGDLTVVYPIARGIAPILVPVIAVVLFDEAISSMAVIGIGLIVIGIFVVALTSNYQKMNMWDIFHALRYPVLIGLSTTAYSLVDKSGVTHVQPFLYMYLMTLGSFILLIPYILIKHGLDSLVNEWKHSRIVIIVSGLCIFGAYGLVLTALSISKVSYIVPAREVGIVIGVILGIFVLKEPSGVKRLIGAGLIVSGLFVLALAP